MTLGEQFGQIDIYLFDQILRGAIQPGMRVLDAGCGSGRNLVYLLREGYDVYGVDRDALAVDGVKTLAATLAPDLPEHHFQLSMLERLPFGAEFADVVLCNAVLHFARNRAHFGAMLQELWRVLRPGGLLFARLGSRIGMTFPLVRDGIYRIGGGAEWFLVSEAELIEWTDELGATLQDPLKTTIVGNQRCMTTWVLRKR